MTSESSPEEILAFWFGPHGEERPFWFSSTPSWDAKIRQRFLQQHEKAASGVYAATWTLEPRSTLALILLLDQVPRNIFRGSARQYATGAEALEVAKIALARGFVNDLKLDAEKKFCIMPFCHSEMLEDQDQAVELFKVFKKSQPGWYEYAKGYHEIIRRFGRFPHRNHILGRKSTVEELAFLGKH